MLVYRLVYNATGADVADVTVSGRLVMADRKILTVDETEVLEHAQSVYRRFVERANLAPHTRNPDHF
jgi:5-methylthioadenosine/S-adenosylhomocysteine deaminase